MVRYQPVVIELGDVSGRYHEFAPESASRSRRHSLRGVALGAIVAVTLALVASAVPVPHILVPTLTLDLGPSGAMAVDDEAVYVPAQGPQGVRLASYRLSDGELRWSVPVRAPRASNVNLQRFGDLLVATVWTEVTPNREPVTTSVAYDPATGTAMWQREGSVIDEVAGGRVLVWRETARDPPAAPRAVQFTAVAARSGEPAWSVSLSPDEYRMFAFDPPGPAGIGRLVTLNGAGRLRVVDLATGVTAAERNIEPPTGDAQLSVVGDVVLLTAPGPSGVDAYAVRDLSKRWTTDGWPRDRAVASACGGWICLPGADALRAVDPGTGAAVWTLPGAIGAYEMGPPWPRGVVMTFSTDGTAQTIVEAGRGRVVADLAGWQPVGLADDGSILVASQPDGADPIVVWLGRYRPGAGGVELLTRMADQSLCRKSGDYLLCRTERNDVTVSRLRI